MKRSEAGMIVEPVTLPPDALVRDALALMAHYKVSGVPITDARRASSSASSRTATCASRTNVDQPVSALMTVAQPRHRAGRDDARTRRRRSSAATRSRSSRSSMPTARLRGLITVKDIQKKLEYPDATKDERGRLRVGAAVGVGPDAVERAQALVAAGVDVLVVDTAHGHSHGVLEMVRAIKDARHDRRDRRQRRDRPRAPRRSIDAGADGVKVGVGPRAALHDARRRRRRRAAGDGGLRRRAGAAARRAGDRRRRHHVLGRRREGDRRRRGHGHGRLAARRHRRGAGRGDRRPGRAVQGVPRHGLARRDARALVLEGPLLPGRRRGRREARARRGSRAASRTRARSRRSSTSSSAACARRWATAAPRRSTR